MRYDYCGIALRCRIALHLHLRLLLTERNVNSTACLLLIVPSVTFNFFAIIIDRICVCLFVLTSTFFFFFWDYYGRTTLDCIVNWNWTEITNLSVHPWHSYWQEENNWNLSVHPFVPYARRTYLRTDIKKIKIKKMTDWLQNCRTDGRTSITYVHCIAHCIATCIYNSLLRCIALPFTLFWNLNTTHVNGT
jgi:hypothetical protein